MTVFLTTHYMEEAQKIANKIAIIDHGKIVAEGNPEDLKEKTGAKTLEDAFLSLTGKKIREEESGSIDQMRMNRKLWSR